MFKAARPNPAASSSAAFPTAATVPALDGKDQGSVMVGPTPPGGPSLGIQDAAQEASADPDALHHTETELDCSRMPEGRITEQNESCAYEVGQLQQTDQATLARLQSKMESDAHASEQGDNQAMSAAPEAIQGDGDDASSDALLSIDLAEQKQILHELWLEKNALSARTAAKRPAAVGKKDAKRTKFAGSGSGRQKQISAMLKTEPPP